MAALSELYKSAAVRTLETQAIERAGDGGWGLMQQAGQAAWALLQQEWPQARRLLVLVGSGNNGGDGYVLARLAVQQGCAVTVMALRIYEVSARRSNGCLSKTDRSRSASEPAWFIVFPPVGCA